MNVIEIICCVTVQRNSISSRGNSKCKDLDKDDFSIRPSRHRDTIILGVRENVLIPFKIRRKK